MNMKARSTRNSPRNYHMDNTKEIFKSKKISICKNIGRKIKTSGKVFSEAMLMLPDIYPKPYD